MSTLTTHKPTRRRPKVRSWADGWGVWHVEVTAPRLTHPRSTRRLARKAMTTALRERAARGETPHFRLVATSTIYAGRSRVDTYAERTR